MWVNNLPKVASQWNSGATRDPNRGHRARIPSALTTTSLSHVAVVAVAVETTTSTLYTLRWSLVRMLYCWPKSGVAFAVISRLTNVWSCLSQMWRETTHTLRVCYFNQIIILRWIKINISLVLISPGSAGTDAGWVGNLNGHSVSSCVRNVRTKKILKSIFIFLQVAIDYVGDPFRGHILYYYYR